MKYYYVAIYNGADIERRSRADYLQYYNAIDLEEGCGYMDVSEKEMHYIKTRKFSDSTLARWQATSLTCNGELVEIGGHDPEYLDRLDREEAHDQSPEEFARRHEKCRKQLELMARKAEANRLHPYVTGQRKRGYRGL